MMNVEKWAWPLKVWGVAVAENDEDRTHDYFGDIYPKAPYELL
jgi:hypothetical protein